MAKRYLRAGKMYKDISFEHLPNGARYIFTLFNIMRRILLAAICGLCICASNAQTKVYQYNVFYALGLLHKDVGHATVSITTDGCNFIGVLHGRSLEWGGRIYAVRDTLHATMHRPVPGDPIGISERVNFQVGWYAKPLVEEIENGSFSLSNPKNYRNTRGEGRLDASDDTMEAITITSDMLGLFYFFKYMDFTVLKRSRAYVVPIVKPGGAVQHLSITYLGTDCYKVGKKSVPTYRVQFDYCFEGEPSGYPIDCQIEQNSRVPVEFSAGLKIGHFKMVRMPDS